MSTPSSSNLEYKAKKIETPFETFLRYTDEKAVSATVLANILEDHLAEGASMLDIGAGNGEYLGLALQHIPTRHRINVTLVEPSQDLLQPLSRRFTKQLPDSHVEILNTDLQNFASDKKFDLILMAHLFYHIAQPARPEQLQKAIGLLKPGGTLIIVLREQDDIADYKNAFKPLLFDKEFKALVLDDVLTALPDPDKLHIDRRIVDATLRIPINENMEDTIGIIEFLLNKPWMDIPKDIQLSALQFIRDKEASFSLRDGVAVITKRHAGE